MQTRNISLWDQFREVDVAAMSKLFRKLSSSNWNEAENIIILGLTFKPQQTKTFLYIEFQEKH